MDYFDAFHRILVVSMRLMCILDHHCSDLGDVLHAHACDFTNFAAMKGHYVATAPTNGSLAVSCQGLLIGVHLWCTIGCGRRPTPSEALLDEGVDIEAEVDPSISYDHGVGNPGVHLVRYDASCTVAEH